MGKVKVLSSPEYSAGELSLRRTIEVIYSLISLSHSVRVFPGKWQMIRNKLEELSSGLVSAENCDSDEHPLVSNLIPAVIATIEDCQDHARRCVDLSYSGKLLMQSDLDLISARLDCHIKKLSGIYTAGILTNGGALVVLKPNLGANRDDMKFYLKDLLTRMKIGDSGMKKQALAGLNEVLSEDDKYVKLLVGMGESISLLVNFLDSLELEIQQEASMAISLISGFDSFRGILIGAGIIAPLIRVLECGSELGKKTSARALQKLTQNGDNAWSVSAHGGVTALLRICAAAGGGEQRWGELVTLACGVLKNVSGVEEIKKFMIEENAVSTFMKLARSKDESLQISSIDMLQILSFKDEPIKQMVLKEGAIRVLIRMLDPKSSSTSSSKVTEMALRAIESICLLSSPSPNCINMLISYGFLDHLFYLVRNGEGSVLEEALRVAVRFCGVSEETKKAMGDAGFMPELVKLLGAKSFEVREMAAEALSGMVSISRNRRRFVQDDGNVGLVLQLLDPELGSEASVGNRKFLLSTVMELTGCHSGRRKIANSGYVKNIEKLAEAEVSDAKRIVKKLSGNRLRSLLSGFWNS